MDSGTIATIGKQAFSHDRCNIFSGLNYIQANNQGHPTISVRETIWDLEFSENLL